MSPRLSNLLQKILSPPHLPEQASLSSDENLMHYHQALDALDSTPDSMFAVLLARDQLETGFLQTRPVRMETVQTINTLDGQLRQKLTALPNEKMAEWRKVIHPPASAWWWFADVQVSEIKKQHDVVWELTAGTLMVLTAGLALEIIKRFWEGAPDSVSVWGTLITLLLTASPFVKQGWNVMQWLLARVPFIKIKYSAEIMTAMAGLAFVILMGVRFWLLPGPLTTYYNNAGVLAQAEGNLSLAQQLFQRAAALNPDRVVPYQNLADAYLNEGLADNAAQWYQKAIEQDSSFAPAFRGLGALLNQQGKYLEAEQVLTAGLNVRMSGADDTTQKVTHYELLVNLGWSYWGQKKTELSQVTFESALGLEAELKTLGEANNIEYRLALPHYYLAQIYEDAGSFAMARQQWEDSLRYLDPADWNQRERYLIAQQHLKNLEGK